MHALCYKGHPLSLTILGETRNIKSITRNDLLKYIQLNYTPDRMIVIGTGAIQHQRVTEKKRRNLVLVGGVV